jgi:hypothetical protein
MVLLQPFRDPRRKDPHQLAGAKTGSDPEMWSMQQLADELNRERLDRAEHQRPARQQRAIGYRVSRTHLRRQLTAAAGLLLRMSTQTGS